MTGQHRRVARLTDGRAGGWTGDGAFTRDLTSYDDWRTVLQSLGVGLTDVTGDELRSLHARMLAAHEKR